MKNIIRICLYVSQFLNISISSAQPVTYNLADIPIERNRIKVGVTSVFLKVKLHGNVKWYHAIEPRWINVAGLQIGDETIEVFRNDFSDGYLRNAYFYQSSSSLDEYVIVAVHAFDDGLSHYHLFHYISESVSYLGDLAFFSVIEEPFLGLVNIFPKKKMSIIKENQEFRLLFDSGRYDYWHHFQGHEHFGPLSFKLKQTPFV